MFQTIDALIRRRPEVVGFAILVACFLTLSFQPGNLARWIASLFLWVGFFHGVASYGKINHRTHKRYLAAVTAMCLVAAIGLDYVAFQA